MTNRIRRGFLVLIMAVLPGFFYLKHMPTWALGAVVGEALGLGHFAWVGATVRLGLGRHLAWFLVNSFVRLGVAGAVLFLVIKWPVVNIWSVLAGFSVTLLPAAFLWRNDQTNAMK